MPLPPEVPASGLGGLERGLLAAVALGGLIATLGPVDNNDIGFHLRLGQEIALAGPPRADHHSFTAPGAIYPDHEWLSQWLLWQVHEVGGVPALALAQGLLVGLTLALVAAGTPGPALLRGLCLLPVLLLGLDHAAIRPHLLGWVWLALLSPLLQAGRWSAVLALIVLWANTHASAPLGVGLAGLVCLGEWGRSRAPRWLALGLALALAPLLNPYGLHAYGLFLQISRAADFVGEWRPYPWASWQMGMVLVTLWAGGAAALRSPTRALDLIRLGVLGGLALQTSRSGVVMAIALAPAIGASLGPQVARLPPKAQRVGLGLVAALALGLGAWRAAQGQSLRPELDPRRLPVAAVDFIQREGLSGPIFNDYNFGGYLLWKAPELPVFVDGRLEVYDGPVMEEHLRLSRAEGDVQAALDRWDVQLVLIRPERALSQLLLQSPRWDLVYFDYNSAIYLRAGRRGGPPALRNASPYGNRDPSKPAEAAHEVAWVVAQNPDFFGGYKILAFLLYRMDDAEGSASALARYLELQPQGADLADTRELLAGLERRGAWPSRRGPMRLHRAGPVTAAGVADEVMKM